MGTASSELVGTVVGSLGSAGISSSDVRGALDKITAEAVDSLDEISGFDVNPGSAVDNIQVSDFRREMWSQWFQFG